MSTSAVNFWVIIPAGGQGSRYDTHTPKQFSLFHDQPLWRHTLHCFSTQAWIKKIMIALNDSTHQHDFKDYPQVQVVAGGASRVLSVYSALKSLQNQAAPQDWVLVHDVVRPCLHPHDLNNVVQSLKSDAVGGILASPVTDTLKYVQNASIAHTVSRKDLYKALTPQMFRYEILRQALSQGLESSEAITDEASAVERLGYQPKIVEALYPNPKLTFPSDSTYINFLLAQRLEEHSL